MTAREFPAACLNCHMSDTRILPTLSELHPHSDVFVCGRCDHIWKVPKEPASHAGPSNHDDE